MGSLRGQVELHSGHLTRIQKKLAPDSGGHEFYFSICQKQDTDVLNDCAGNHYALKCG
jgi:hypothetical protein